MKDKQYLGIGEQYELAHREQLINSGGHEAAHGTWFWVLIGLLLTASIVYGLWRIGDATGEAVDRRYCTTASEQAYDGHPCPEGTRQ